MTVHAGDGLNVLNVNDHGDTADHTAVTVASDTISGLSVGTITYTTDVPGTPGTVPVGGGSFRGGVNIQTGTGVETVTISSTRTDDITSLWLNSGDDVVTISDDGTVTDGLLVIHGEEGGDSIDTTLWTTDMIIFGDYGQVNYNGTDLFATYNGGLTQDMNRLTIVSAETFNPTVGGNDFITTGDGNDYIFGGAADDTVYAGGGDDILIGDGGMITMKSGQLYIVETIDHFIGGDDFLDSSSGNNIILGAYGSDTLVGNLTNDLMFGEYARIIFKNGLVQSIVRLAQGAQDIIGSNQFDLYGSPFGANAYEDEVSYFGTEAIIEELNVKGGGYGTLSSASILSTVETEKIREKQIEEVKVANTSSESEIIDEFDVDIVKGGNLWNLAMEYYGDPFLWDKIWKANPEIKDPDVIDVGQDIKVPKDIPEWLMKGKEAPEEDSQESTETGEIIDEEAPLLQEETGEINDKDKGREIDNSHEMEKRKEDADSDESEQEDEEFANEADLGFLAVGLAGWRAVASSGLKGQDRMNMDDAFNDMAKKMAKSRHMRWKDGKVIPLRGESKKGRKGFKIIQIEGDDDGRNSKD